MQHVFNISHAHYEVYNNEAEDFCGSIGCRLIRAAVIN
jgi:hypothetical protein